MLFDLFSLTDGELLELRQKLRETRRAAYAQGTHKNHMVQWRTYLSFCYYFNLEALPASLETICLYCQYLSSFLTPGSVKNYLSGVKALHIVSGTEFMHSKAPELRLTLRGIDRLAQHCPEKAPPVTPTILYKLVRISDFSKAEDLVYMTSFLFAFFLFARISNIVPQSVRAFDPRKNLCRKDIVSTEYGLSVTFRWTKTLQFGQRKLIIPLLAIPGSPLCPVDAYKRMCRLVQAPLSSPAFVLPSSSGLSCITKSLFVNSFRSRLALAGIKNPCSFRGHSFRRGVHHGLSMLEFQGN